MELDQDRPDVEAARSGEELAFRRLVDKYREKAMGLALTLMKDEVLAAEVVQSAFVKAFTSLPKFRFDSSFSTWFYRIVYTTGLNELRSRRRSPMFEELNEDTLEVWVEPELFDALDRPLIIQTLRDELDNMPTKYATIIDLFYVNECSHAEIGRITGLPIGTIKTRLSRGRALLRSSLERKIPELKGSTYDN